MNNDVTNITEAVETKIAARRAADELHQIAMDEACKHQGAAALTFWKYVLKNVLAVLPTEHHPIKIIEKGPWAAMKDGQAREFERTAMLDFGIHESEKIEDVPLDYLLWLDEQQWQFQRNLNRYLRSDHIQKQQGSDT